MWPPTAMLVGGTKGEIGAPNRGQQPIYLQSNALLLQQNWASGARRFPNLHVIAGRHHQIGRPGYALTEPHQNWRGGFGDAVTMLTARRRVGQIRPDPIASVAKASSDHARARQRVKYAQQARFGY